MERMGKDPNPDTVKLIEGSIFPLEVLQAFQLHSFLPDVWDGAGGNYFGKDWSALGTLLDKLEIDEPKSVIYFLRVIDGLTTKNKNEDIQKDRKRRDKTSKGPIGQKKGIEVHG